MGFFDSLFNPGKGYKKAGEQYEKYYNQAQGYMDPYMQQGKNQMGRLNEAENSLLDPAGLENKWASGYEMSPYAKQMQDQAKGSGMDALSSMGLLGSSTGINTLQQGASNIMNKDRQQYMNDLMDKYKTGIGLGQGMYNTGAGMASNMGTNAMNQGNRMGEAKFGQQNAQGDMFRNMINQAIKAAMMAGMA